MCSVLAFMTQHTCTHTKKTKQNNKETLHLRAETKFLKIFILSTKNSNVFFSPSPT